MVALILISIILGMVFLVIFGGFIFNDDRIDWGITIFTLFMGIMFIAIPVSYLMFKVYR